MAEVDEETKDVKNFTYCSRACYESVDFCPWYLENFVDGIYN